MLIRRLLGGALLLALLAPVLFAALPGAPRAAAPAAFGTPGGDCCVVMPCCATGGSCATGTCETPKATAAATSSASTPTAAPESTPRLAAGCPGPAPATLGVAHHDPMIPAAGKAMPAPRPRITATTSLSWSTSERADDPRVPPPRA